MKSGQQNKQAIDITQLWLVAEIELWSDGVRKHCGHSFCLYFTIVKFYNVAAQGVTLGHVSSTTPGGDFSGQSVDSRKLPANFRIGINL